MEGTVKWYNRKKGFGFIIGEDNVEYFVHYTGLTQGTFIRDNDKVGFDAVETEKGKQAQNVVLLQKASEMAQGGAPQESFGEEEPKEEFGQEPAEEQKEEAAAEQPEEQKEEQPEEAKQE